jgi:hypothetical protein
MQVFSSREDFERQILSQMNALNGGDDFYSWRVTEKYVIIKCKHCHNFQIWYTYSKTANGGYT